MTQLDSRYWKYVDKTDGCWLWIGYKNHLGYGRLTIRLDFKKYKLMAAHRLSYEAHKGEIPPGKVVMHSCDNPSCVNPEHLLLGTQSDNVRDMNLKGRANMKGLNRWGNIRAPKKVA